MTQKHKHFILNRYTTSALVFLIIAAASTVVVLQRNHTEAAPAVKSSAATTKSEFSFNASSAPDWSKGPSNKTSLALFYKPADCFTSVEYRPGTVDMTAELQKSEDGLVSAGYTTTPGSILAVTLQTGTGEQQYQLHQYSVTGTGSAGKPYGGHEFGYLQLPKGYIKVQGWCDTTEHLAATIPALQAVKFDESK